MSSRFSSRRQFLFAGGAAVTTLAMNKKPPVEKKPAARPPAGRGEDEKRLREIMERYGAELGRPRWTGR